MRLLTIAILILILIIPTSLIQDLVDERELRSNDALAEVSEKWGTAQTLSGPILSIPFQVQEKTTEGKVYTRYSYAHFLPDKLKVSGTIDPTIRHRGIYEFVLYQSNLVIQGHFHHPSFEGLNETPEIIHWNRAFLSFGITDLKGITRAMDVNWNKTAYEAAPGMKSTDVIHSGVVVDLDLSQASQASQAAAGSHTFSIKLELRGAQKLYLLPTGKTTEFHLTSPWDTPSFQGAFLPRNYTLTTEGFTADWLVLHLNRNFPQQWVGSTNTMKTFAFGVTMMLPMDSYQETTRTIKYALLFISLTFIAYFLMEIVLKHPLHPIQYLAIGTAMVLFYALLLSLSEHIGFDGAYGIAMLAVSGVIAGYTGAIFQTRRAFIGAGTAMILLYVTLFVILKLVTYALLLGTMLLFVMLTLFMYLTRSVDWSSFEKPQKDIHQEHPKPV